jgi:phage shock protein A
MSISRRIATLFRVKANKALDRAEDPREMLDYSYEQQLEMVQKVRRGLADVATSRKRVELQLTQLQLSAGKLQGQAQQALGAGREDLAREALIRRAAVTSQVTFCLAGQRSSGLSPRSGSAWSAGASSQTYSSSAAPPWLWLTMLRA